MSSRIARKKLARRKVKRQVKPAPPELNKLFTSGTRNMPCVCGSGLKYKACCLRKEGLLNKRVEVAAVRRKHLNDFITSVTAKSEEGAED